MTLRSSNAFVDQHHRHSKPVRGCKFCIGAFIGDELVGVAIVGRPIARMLDDGTTAEVLRVCVVNDASNACSFLYGAARRIWRSMGGLRLITYTLERESGVSLRASGWKPMAASKAGEWTRLSRERKSQTVYAENKIRWEAS